MVSAKTFGVSGLSGLVLTWLGANLNEQQVAPLSELEIPPSAKLDQHILHPWTSEDVFVQGNGVPYPDECTFFNFSATHGATYCDSFTVSRTLKSTIATATDRAVRCAAEHELECVLSHEVGFALPALFLADVRSERGMRALVAPRVVNAGDEDTHVRITPPDRSLSRTVLMSAVVEVEFMDDDKRLQTETLEGQNAFCVQLLRASYDAACWRKLDG